MTKEELEIVEIVNRETKAWDTQDTSLLITLFHPDMVWPWPQTPQSHDPMEWELVLGKAEGMRDFQSIVTIQGRIVANHSLADLELMLPEGFVRCHKSYCKVIQ